jgi:hypothetical protein
LRTARSRLALQALTERSRAVFRARFEFAALEAVRCALTLEQLHAPLVGAFLAQLVTSRHNTAATRKRPPHSGSTDVFLDYL